MLRCMDNQAVAYTVSLKKSSVLHYVKIIKFESLRKGTLSHFDYNFLHYESILHTMRYKI